MEYAVCPKCGADITKMGAISGRVEVDLELANGRFSPEEVPNFIFEDKNKTTNKMNIQEVWCNACGGHIDLSHLEPDTDEALIITKQTEEE